MTATREVGVAIGLPEPHHSELTRWRERLGDPHAARIPPHITLLPPTALDADRLDEVEEHLRKVAEAEQAFAVHLRGTGTFRPVSPVVFVTVAEGISDCERVQEGVRSGPLERALDFPYHPHVTVAHDLPDESLDRAFEALVDYDARFECWGFSLFERGADSAWRPLRDFPFGHATPGPHPH